ncbi:serine/threonine-protein kinase [Streptomyces griseorubiginosus]|uniref:serine/threonine-protein kinase n=1 Tax=Streptomyces griseorubiginosus TaxID=67304 RepID=UPI003664F37A
MRDLTEVELDRRHCGLLVTIGTQQAKDPDGQWPMWEWVEHRASSFGLENPREVLYSLPRIGAPAESFGLSYGFTTNVPRILAEDTRIALTAAAAFALDEVKYDLGDPFMRVLHHMIALWRSAPRSPNEVTRVQLTSEELQAAFPHMRPRIIRLMPEYIANEPLLSSSRSRQEDGSWTIEIPRQVMRYEHAKSLRDYVSEACQQVHQAVEADRKMFGGLVAPAPTAEPAPAPEPETDTGVEEVRVLLKQEWFLGGPIGDPGGFGAVYAARSADGTQAAAKLVPKRPGADREMLFTDLPGVRNVVPVIDSGEHDDHWVLVMPRAKKSLRAHLQNGPLALEEAVRVLTDIAETLTDLDGQVVHRDLKPENVLLLNGRWCLADFGIARYAEATTAQLTYKFHGTLAYMAPERWKNQRATSASDIYALGVLAYELLEGTTPFTGPDEAGFADQHLRGTPSPLTAAPALLAALITECLYKAPQARPAPANVLERLRRIPSGALTGGLAALAEADWEVVARRAEDDRQASEQATETERREDLFAAAVTSLNLISEQLLTAITGVLSTATVHRESTGGWTMHLSGAELALTGPQEIPEAATAGAPQPFDVIAAATVTVKTSVARRGYEGRSHSLWYADAQVAEQYQWFETAFMTNPFSGMLSAMDPFALDPQQGRAAIAGGIGTRQAAWPFTPLGIGELDEFIDRWARWLADGATGRLEHPSTMPERDPQGSWRR